MSKALFFLSFCILTISCRNTKLTNIHVDKEFSRKVNNYFYSVDKQLFVNEILSQDSLSDLNNFLDFFSRIEQEPIIPDSLFLSVQDSSYYYLINSIVLFDKDTLESKKNILKSIALNSDNFFGKLWLCNYFKNNENNTKECLNCYKKILLNYNDIALGHYYFVDYLILTNRFQEAMEHLKNTMPKFEQSYLFYNQKSFIEVKQGDLQNAIESINKALVISYNLESLKLLGAIYLFEIKNNKLALETLKKGLALSNTDSELLNMLAEVYWFENEYDSSVYYFNETLKNIKDQKEFQNVFADYLDFILLEKGKEELLEVLTNAKFEFSIDEVSIIYYIIVDLKFNNNLENANNLFIIYEKNYPDNVKWAKERIFNWYQSEW